MGTAPRHKQGDIAETRATASLFGSARADQFAEELSRAHPGCLRGFGVNVQHSDDACGVVRADFELKERRSTLRRARLHRRGPAESIDVEYVMNNNFAFGGVNTSLIFRRWPE